MFAMDWHQDVRSTRNEISLSTWCILQVRPARSTVYDEIMDCTWYVNRASICGNGIVSESVRPAKTGLAKAKVRNGSRF